MSQLGYIALLIAFAVAVYSAIVSVVGDRSGKAELVVSAQRGVVAVFAMLTLAAISLLFLLTKSDFSIEYVASYSNRAMPLFYKLSAWWGGQAGSLLLWSWMLAGFSAFVVIQNRNRQRTLMPYVVATLMVISTFFIMINLFIANPFDKLGIVQEGGRILTYWAPDGKGLNPILQHPAMVIHPPMLYMGFVGFSVPFAFAIAALVTGQLGDTWVRTTRRWTILPWFFLGTGLLLGGRWAYDELGWGGYWAWDPVENSSLMPWLVGTAYLHSVMVQEKKGMLKVWNVVLILLTFTLCILGTFITRSGVISSVHAFAQSAIGPFFGAFLIIIIGVSAYLVIIRLPDLKSENELDSLTSRESGFLFNNLILLVACFAVLLGTLFPIISEAVRGVKITVGPPFFNKINIPIALLLLFLTGVGPLLAWRRTSIRNLKKNFSVPLLISIPTGAAFFYAMKRNYGASVYSDGINDIYTLVCFILGIFVALTIFTEFYRGARARGSMRGENLIQGLINLTLRNKRRYGGYIIHFGIVLIFVGIAGTAFNKEEKAEIKEGEEFTIGHYTLLLLHAEDGQTDNYDWSSATLEIFRKGKKIDVMVPEKRFYKAQQQPTTEVALRQTLKEDLYLVYAGKTDDGERVIIQAWVNPLVTWLWIGALVMTVGTIICMLPDSRERRFTSTSSSRQKREAVAKKHEISA